VIAIMYELMIDLNKRLFVYAQMSMKQQTVCILMSANIRPGLA